jgi:hypothetical protein
LVDKQSVDLAFAVGPVKVHAKDFLALVGHVGGQATSPAARSDYRKSGLLYSRQELKRDFNKLVLERTLLPDGADHQHPIVTAEVRDRMLDQCADVPFSSFGSTEFRDTDLIGSGRLTSFTLD